MARRPLLRVHRKALADVSYAATAHWEDRMRYQASAMAAATAAAGLTMVACSSGGGAAAGPSASAIKASVRPLAASGEPQTVAAVRSDADDYLSLYSAGQYAITYQMLSAAARQAITEQAWVAVHKGCPGAGRAYQVVHVVVTGKTAVVTASLPGSGKQGTQTETLIYANGHWGVSPRDLSLYQHGTVAAAAARAGGRCAS